jgi:hypothetical protein
MGMMDQQVIFGFEDQWQEFNKRNEEFLSRLPNLKAVCDLSFYRELEDSQLIDRVLYMLGHECEGDFWEILLLAGNGYGRRARCGVGALKILRGLYERAVTLVYLSEHPDEVELFVNYFAVSQHKLLAAIQRTFGPDTLADDPRTKEQEQLYKDVSDNYRITECKNCGGTRINHTWNKLDFVAMAHKTGELGKLIVPAYYWPLRHTHPTVAGMLARVEQLPLGAIGFNTEQQPKEADEAVRLANSILLQVLETQQKHFTLDTLKEPLQTCFKDFEEVWVKRQASRT